MAENRIGLNMDFRIENLSYEKILNFCEKIGAQHPFLFTNINLGEYVEKMSTNALFITCRHNKEIVGFLSFYMNNAKYVYITLVGVLEQFQGKHLFKKMLCMLEALCFCQDYKEIKLEVANENEKAKKVYLKLGFVEERRGDHSIFMHKFVNK